MRFFTFFYKLKLSLEYVVLLLPNFLVFFVKVMKPDLWTAFTDDSSVLESKTVKRVC